MDTKTLQDTADKIEAIGNMIRATNGKVFSATWIAGLNKEPYLRSGLFRLDVKKGTTGKGMAYNPKDYGYISVFDMGIARRKAEELKRLTALQERGKDVTKDIAKLERETCFRMLTLSTLQKFACSGQTWNK